MKRMRGRLAVLIGESAAHPERRAARRRHGRRASRRPGVRRRLHAGQARRRRRRFQRPDRLDAAPAAQPGMGDWVRYKLDRAVDHVLVDEAQDTNAAQWEIVERWSRNISAASSEAERRGRTLFMVGDFKQAIYGFQGTDPRRVRRGARGCSSGARPRSSAGDDLFSYQPRAREFRDLSIAASFRSAQPMLDVVDAVIETVGTGSAGACANRRRRTARIIATGRASVELWQPFAVEESPDDSDEGEERWLALRDRRYADALAERIQAMVDEAPVLASTGRPLTPGDILILVRSRGELASLIVARLFSARRAGRRRRPAAPARAARGPGPARRGHLRGAAARRPQPRLPAGLAADRLGPGAAARARLRAARAACGASCGERAGESGDSAPPTKRWPSCCAIADFTHAVALPRDDPVRADGGPAQALLAARHGGARPDRRADEQRARVRAQRDRRRSTASSPGSRAATSTSSAIPAGRRTRCG